MAKQKWVAVVEGVIVGTFDTEKEAWVCEQNNRGRLALIDAINTCSCYECLDTD